MSRRSFLNIGTLAALGTSSGWSLPSVLRAEEASGKSGSAKSVIMIYLVGGPPHQDMFDLKPEAPSEIAGPWKPIATNVPGMEICEAFPRLAALGDKLTIIRSLVGNQADHDAIQVFNGRHPKKPRPAGGWPQFGSLVSRVVGPTTGAAPFVDCVIRAHGPYNEPGPGFWEPLRRPFRPGPTRDDMVFWGITPDRLADQRTCWPASTGCDVTTDATMTMSGIDTFTEQAMGLLASSRLAEALDLSREDPAVVERYGTGNRKSSLMATELPGSSEPADG
ncbi:MAG: DUF1501 domain-containing protein [Planctomycetaceae bacterium]